MNILLIDDEADVRKSLARFLQKLGHTVVCAADGMEALREFHLREINLVITDIRMPEIDGIELLRRIKVIEKSPVDVIVVTGDHATPARMAGHSWHPLPLILHSQWCLIDNVKKFDEVSCITGALGRMRSVELMPLVLAHAQRLTKFGA